MFYYSGSRPYSIDHGGTRTRGPVCQVVIDDRDMLVGGIWRRSCRHSAGAIGFHASLGKPRFGMNFSPDSARERTSVPAFARGIIGRLNNARARDAIQAVYPMSTSAKYSMLVKCEKCGYENFPQHRFCGMCGVELPPPQGLAARPSPEPLAPAPKPVSRPSIAAPLGRPAPAALEQERVDPRSVSYLLEDEPAPIPWGRYVLLFVLVAGVAGGWYWREDLGPLATKLWGRATGAPVNSSAPAAPEAASQSTAVPASGTSTGSQVEKPNTAAGDQTSQAQTPQPSPGATTGAPSTADSAQPDQSQPAPSSDSAAATNVPKADDSGEAASQPAPAVKPPTVRTRPAAAPSAGIDGIEAEGERYLYGNGVPENCARARKNLLAAAQHNNAKAQNVLGTMYATGHCATRDLPTAYRWFGRSLRQDPSNTRIEQDLKVLWSQMTPEEQKLALRDTR
jgi:hypothetical protein